MTLSDSSTLRAADVAPPLRAKTLGRPSPVESSPSSTVRSGPHTEKIPLGVTPRQGWLLEVQDDAGARIVPIDASPKTLGASRRADVVVNDVTVSAVHCSIVATPEGVLIKDLGSTNGTFSGGGRVREVLGARGATITLGQTTLTVCAAETVTSDEELGEPLPMLAGGSVAMLRVAAQVRLLAKLGAPVLIAGESGVGKELVARALHDEGPRARAPFVALNASSLPRELVESELFGHERGAFTGALQRRPGAFEEAASGTLFLDEIGELALEAQPKLLRALDGYEVRRVGATGPGVKLDARIVSATHVPMAKAVADGKFRRDLFHRLEVFVVEIPPLRERRGDVRAIAEVLLRGSERDVGRRKLTPSAIAQLAAHDWPGNVRQLRNVLLRAAATSKHDALLDASDVQRGLHAVATERSGLAHTITQDDARALLVAHGGNQSAAARAAGLARTTFRNLLSGRDR